MNPLYSNVNHRLVCKRFKNKMFYLVTKQTKGSPYTVESGFLSSFPNSTYVFFTPCINGVKRDYKRMFDWKDLFESYDEANKIVTSRNKLLKSFRYPPFITEECLLQHSDKLNYIEQQIDKLLTNFENYNGIDFCDVGAGGIQVRIHHKAIKGYTYGDQKTIKYDFSNFKEIPLQVVEEFLKIDNPEAISKQQEFIRMGEKYGWD